MNALTFALSQPAVTLASSDDGGSAVFGLILFVVPFVVGWFVYTTLYRRYRNQDKRYHFESTTSAERSKLQRWDTFSRKNNGQRSSQISGRNDNSPLDRASHSVVREAQAPRVAQEERLAQEARDAQPARDAQEAREAQEERGTPQSPSEQPGQ